MFKMKKRENDTTEEQNKENNRNMKLSRKYTV